MTKPNLTPSNLSLESRVAAIEATLAGVPPLIEQQDRSIVAVIRAAAFQCGVRASEITGPARYRPIVRARFATIWVSRKALSKSLSVIGRVLDRDHTSIVNGLRRAEQMRDGRDPAFMMLTDRLLAHFQAIQENY